MADKQKNVASTKQGVKNPAVDPKLVKEAIQAKKELEALGVWEDRGSQVRSPHIPLPNSRSQDQLLRIRAS